MKKSVPFINNRCFVNAKNITIKRCIYSFLKLILANEFGHVGVKIIDRNAIVKPKNTKMRRKIISV